MRLSLFTVKTSHKGIGYHNPANDRLGKETHLHERTWLLFGFIPIYRFFHESTEKGEMLKAKEVPVKKLAHK